MLQTMHPKLHAAFDNFFPKRSGNPVFFRNKVKHGPEPHFLFKVYKPPAIIMAALGIHIVRQHNGELFPLRPSRPVFRGSTGIGIDGPDAAEFFALIFDALPAQKYLKAPGNTRFQVIEDFV